jgi:hypothetical protein
VTVDQAIETELDFFNMANLSPLFTGLPFVVWISVKGNAKHDIRVKVSRQRGELISVALRPMRVIGEERLSGSELTLLESWISLNWDVLLAYWNEELYTEQVIGRLKPVEGGA